MTLDATPSQQNPFSPFTPAVENFVGRQELIDRLLVRFHSDRDKFHVLLTGEGGVGKTSLLLKLLSLILSRADSKEFSPVFVDLGLHVGSPAKVVHFLTAALSDAGRSSSRLKKMLGLPGTATTSEVAAKAVRSIRDGISIGFPFPTLDLAPLFKGQPPKSDLLESLDELQKALETYRGGPKRVVFLIDQFEKSMQMQDHELLLNRLADIFRLADSPTVCFVLCARPEGKGAMEHYVRPDLFNLEFFHHEPLKAFDPDEEAIEMIRQPLQRIGHEVSERTAQAIVAACGPHPYYLQLGCYLIWERLSESDLTASVELDLSEQFVKQCVEEMHHSIFESFSRTEREVLKVLALAATPLDEAEIAAAVVGKLGPGTDATSVRAAIEQLLHKHRHRPIKFLQNEAAYAITHDLLRQHISEHECGEEERELEAVLQEINARTIAWKAGDRLPLSEWALRRIRRFKDRVTLDADQILWLLESALLHSTKERADAVVDVARLYLGSTQIAELVRKAAPSVPVTSPRQFRAIEHILWTNLGSEAPEYKDLIRSVAYRKWVTHTSELPIETWLELLDVAPDNQAFMRALYQELSDVPADSSTMLVVRERVSAIVDRLANENKLDLDLRLQLNEILARAGDDNAVLALIDEFLEVSPTYQRVAARLLHIEIQRIVSVARANGRLRNLVQRFEQKNFRSQAKALGTRLLAVISPQSRPTHREKVPSTNRSETPGLTAEDLEERVWTDPLGRPLDTVGLSSRSCNSLRHAGVDTVGDVLAKTAEDLLSIRNFGRWSLYELRSVLESLGYSPPWAGSQAEGRFLGLIDRMLEDEGGKGNARG